MWLYRPAPPCPESAADLTARRSKYKSPYKIGFALGSEWVMAAPPGLPPPKDENDLEEA
jgi:hypothetical protein